MMADSFGVLDLSGLDRVQRSRSHGVATTRPCHKYGKAMNIINHAPAVVAEQLKTA
jgi:hypothetical protein